MGKDGEGNIRKGGDGWTEVRGWLDEGGGGGEQGGGGKKTSEDQRRPTDSRAIGCATRSRPLLDHLCVFLAVFSRNGGIV